MRKLAILTASLLVAFLVVVEAVALAKYGPIIWAAQDYDKVAPLILSVLTPLVAVITVLVSYLLIDVQFSKNRELEKLKQQMGEVYKRESDAYFKAWNAISMSHRLLSELQRGTFDAAAKKPKIEDAFADAEPYAFILEEEHRLRFYDYWQEIWELASRAEVTASGLPKQDLWRVESPRIVRALHNIQEVFRQEYLGR
jgi:hypothetical protein